MSRQPFGLTPCAMASFDLEDEGDRKDMMEIQYLASKYGWYVVSKDDAERTGLVPGPGQASG